MATFTAEQIGMAAWNAGFGRDVPTLSRAIAVALAESGGNTAAHNPNAGTGDNSYGLWQINMLGAMGPARRKAFGIASNEELFDPQKNANAAWKISNSGRNWTPWSVFKSGTYLKHMTTATAAATALIARAGKNREGWVFSIPGASQAAEFGESLGEDARAAGEAAAGALDVPGAIARAANSFSQSLFKLGTGFVTVAIAVVLLILGVVILMRNPIKKTATSVAGVAGAVVPGGAVAKGAAKAAKIAKAAS